MSISAVVANPILSREVLDPRSVARSAPPMSAAEDLALVQKVIAGDNDAHQLFMEQAQKIAQKCFANVRRRSPWVSQEEADLLQRFWLMLLDKERRVLRTYSGQARLTTWLYVLATRFFQREAGQLKRLNNALDSKTSQEPLDERESAETTQMRRTEIREVRNALARLPSQDRLLLAMLFEQDLPAHEIGQTLGLTPSGVRMKKQRLLKKLAKRLKGLWP